ncbi:hypothetical protein AK88_03538 [Plasmodium fragile]|uniref:CCR4-NOT transcription complex subunit 1 n=1 Tax=Plasmodium fragile TaxID=5857 RepID=A0A0D9QM73_PLAFR|nr:uncharacterized protein AK88_03538 [Plasmodium fragile]KJP86831.1 hypothetical protein AK88_03538 [Plasmodium fragile]
MNNNFNINVQVDNAFLSEHEVEVNGYFAKLYTGEITVDTMIDIMKSLSGSPKGSKNNDVYKSMLLILFNECRFFPKYPSEELDTTAQLFGKLIKHNLLLSYGNTLAVALKCILEAFKKGNDSKMFNFGITALEQFEDSLICYPSFLSSLIAVTTLRQYNPQYVIHCSNLLNTLPEHFRSLPYIDASTILKIKHLAEIGANSSTTDANISQASNDDVKKISTHNGNNLKNVNNLISSMGITMSTSGHVDNTNVSNNLGGSSTCNSNNNNSTIANALNNMVKGNSGTSANLTNDNVLSYISDILPNSSSLVQHHPHLQSSLQSSLQSNQQASQQTTQHTPGRSEHVFKNKNINDNLNGNFNVNINNIPSPVKNHNITTNVNLLNGDKTSTPLGAMNQLYANRSYVSPNGSNHINRILTTQGNPFNLGGREIVSLSNASILNEHAGEIGMSSVVDGSKYASTPEGIKRPNVNLNSDKRDGMTIGNNFASGNPLSSRDKEEQLCQIMESFYDQVQVKLPPNLSLNNIGGFGLGQIECLMDNTDLTKNIIVPSPLIIGEVFSIFNTLCSFNIDEKIKILKEVMQPEHYSWLAFYIVKSRASKEVNLHEVFLEFIDKLSYPMLIDTIINMTYECILILFKYINELKEVSAFKTVLKNLGSWLGFITLGRNRPLKSKILDLKLVLFEAYEKGCLVCILPLICRILESIKLSKNFKPPNPWTTTMLCLLTEIHQLPNVKTYTIFEVEILFKNLALDIHAFKNKTTLLSKRSVAHNRKSELLIPKGSNNNQENSSALPLSEDLKNLPRREGLTGVVNSHIGRVQGGLTLNPRLEELENVTNITARDIPSSVPHNALPSSRFIPEKGEYTRRNNNLPSYNVDYVDSEWSKDDVDRIDALTNDMTLVSTFPPPDVNLINASYNKKVAGGGGKNVSAMGEQHPLNVSYATSASYIGNANHYDNTADYYDGTANYYNSNDNMDSPEISIDNNLINNKINSSKFLQSLNSAIIVSPSIALFQIQPGLKSLVTIAFYQAIREIIAAILDRSVAISCVTTREIVCKDFCLERDETLIRKAAHIMISSLAGSLALVTCKEPLRISLTHHLRHWLEKTSTKDCNDQVLIEQVIQILSADNLELGCSLVEQAVIEKAIKDINEALEPTLLSRQVAKEHRIALNDPIHLMNTKRMQLEIAHYLKLGLPVTNNQLQIYKDFLNIAPLKKLHAAAKALTKIYTKVNDVNVENNQQAGGTLMHALFSNSNLQKKEEKMDYPKNMNEEKRTVNDPPIGMPKSDPTLARKTNTDYNINGNIKTEQSVNSAKRNANENTPPQSSSPSATHVDTNSQLHKILNKLELATNQLKDAIKDILILPPILFNINKEKPSDNINKMSLHILYSLSVDGSIFNLIKSIPEIAALTQHKDETIISYSNRIYKFLFEVIPPHSNKTPWVYRSNDPSGIYLEVFLCILEKLKKKCPLLKEHITDFIMSNDSSSLSNDNSPSCSKPLFAPSNLVKENESDDITKLGSQFPSPTNSNSNEGGHQNKNESETKCHNKGVAKLNANVIAGFIRYNLMDMQKYKYYLVRQLSTDMYSINANTEFVTLLLRQILIDFQIFRYNDFEDIFIILNNLKEQKILTNKIFFFNHSPPIDTNVAIEILTEEAKKIQGKKGAVIFSDLLHVYEEYLKSDDERDQEQDLDVPRGGNTDQMMLRMGMDRNGTDEDGKKGQLQGNQVQNGRTSQHAQGEGGAKREDGLYYSYRTLEGAEAKENIFELKCPSTNNNFHLNEIKKSELMKNPLEYFKRDYNQLSEDLLSSLIEEKNFDKVHEELKSVDNFGLLDMEGIKVHTREDVYLREKGEKARSALSTRTSTNNKSNVDGSAISKTNQENRTNAHLCQSKKQAKREYKKNLKILMNPEYITTLTQIIDFCLNTDWNILQKKKNNTYFKDKGVGGIRVVPKPQKIPKQHEQIISIFFFQWIKLINLKNVDNPNQSYVKFFQNISNQGLLRIDNNTDNFFAVCIYNAVEGGTCISTVNSSGPIVERGKNMNLLDNAHSANGNNGSEYHASATHCEQQNNDTSVTSQKREFPNERIDAVQGGATKGDNNKSNEVCLPSGGNEQSSHLYKNQVINKNAEEGTQRFDKNGRQAEQTNRDEKKEPIEKNSNSSKVSQVSDENRSCIESTNLTFYSNISNYEQCHSDEEEEFCLDPLSRKQRRTKQMQVKKSEMLRNLSAAIDGSADVDFVSSDDKEFNKSETHFNVKRRNNDGSPNEMASPLKDSYKDGSQVESDGDEVEEDEAEDAEQTDDELNEQLDEAEVDDEVEEEQTEVDELEADRVEEVDEVEEEEEEEEEEESGEENHRNDADEEEDEGEEDDVVVQNDEEGETQIESDEEDETDAEEDDANEMHEEDQTQVEDDDHGSDSYELEEDEEQHEWQQLEDGKEEQDELEASEDEADVEDTHNNGESDDEDVYHYNFDMCNSYACRQPEGGNKIGGGTSSAEQPERLTGNSHLDDAIDTLSLDGLAKMIICMMKLVDTQQISPFILFQKVMNVYCRIVVRESRRNKKKFNQRPYFRLFLSILVEINKNEKYFEQSYNKLILAIGYYLCILNPLRVPGFIFAWLELISHKLFLPKILKTSKGWCIYNKLLIYLLEFLYVFLKNAFLTPPIKIIYRGTLRMLLILLHDFPEFLCVYNFSFCNSIPLNCIQMRNLILSAFPRNLKLPHPFYPNLKVDLLPEMKVVPVILNNFTFILIDYNIKKYIDDYFVTRNVISLKKIHQKLLVKNKMKALYLKTKYNIALINALVLYIGMSLPSQILMIDKVSESHPALEIILHLTYKLDMEGRYYLLSSITNHLRYPNAHTHYFSCLLLWIFNISKMEIVNEQITGILLERLIVHRPHPWGLLITFIELIKNPIFKFWQYSFVHVNPDIEKLFQSIAHSCLVNQMEHFSGVGADGAVNGANQGTAHTTSDINPTNARNFPPSNDRINADLKMFTLPNEPLSNKIMSNAHNHSQGSTSSTSITNRYPQKNEHTVNGNIGMSNHFTHSSNDDLFRKAMSGDQLNGYAAKGNVYPSAFEQPPRVHPNMLRSYINYNDSNSIDTDNCSLSNNRVVQRNHPISGYAIPPHIVAESNTRNDFYHPPNLHQLLGKSNKIVDVDGQSDFGEMQRGVPNGSLSANENERNAPPVRGIHAVMGRGTNVGFHAGLNPNRNLISNNLSLKSRNHSVESLINLTNYSDMKNVSSNANHGGH